jgi:GntR family transcriptional repressor for pyruvate dehydrogenase complex
VAALRSESLGDGQVRLPRLADVVAERIRELILLGELKDGERLPPLESLLEQFGVSAPSMREALRILEAEGLIEVQRGSIGGAVVHRPNPKTAAFAIALALRSQGTQKSDVAEALALLAPLCAMLCARRPDRKSKVVRELRKANKEARRLLDGDEMAYNEAMMDFHATLVRQCGNDSLSLLTRALGSIWIADVRAWVRSISARGRYPTPAERVAELELHERITDLIDAGDDVKVAALMTEHVDVTRMYREEVDPTERVDPKAVRLSR